MKDELKGKKVPPSYYAYLLDSDTNSVKATSQLKNMLSSLMNFSSNVDAVSWSHKARLKSFSNLELTIEKT